MGSNLNEFLELFNTSHKITIKEMNSRSWAAKEGRKKERKGKEKSSSKKISATFQLNFDAANLSKGQRTDRAQTHF